MEKPENQTMPASRRPLKVRKDTAMECGKLEGLDKPVSRLVMGVQGPLPHACAMFDDFFERGGNCFDTGYIYGGGRTDRDLGAWIRTRGVRDQVVILAKGAHTPHCNPNDLSSQLLETLDRMQTDHTDIYMMHRDNTDIPVGEFMDVLNEHVRAGRIRAFGGSNWSIPRFVAAQAYAKQKGLKGFSAIGNNLSLARMVEAPWEGCISCSDRESRAWLEKTQFPIMPWSSQAQGFFTGRASPEDRSNAELVRCWYSDDNFKRLARAKEMAAKRGVEPTNIALAHVLCQPYPAFPLIGPKTIAEMNSCMTSFSIELSPADAAWLNLET
jgi:aryl-alcohol dehydrogenase-like predicted oxidoreductase